MFRSSPILRMTAVGVLLSASSACKTTVGPESSLAATVALTAAPGASYAGCETARRDKSNKNRRLVHRTAKYLGGSGVNRVPEMTGLTLAALSEAEMTTVQGMERVGGVVYDTGADGRGGKFVAENPAEFDRRASTAEAEAVRTSPAYRETELPAVVAEYRENSARDEAQSVRDPYLDALVEAFGPNASPAAKAAALEMMAVQVADAAMDRSLAGRTGATQPEVEAMGVSVAEIMRKIDELPANSPRKPGMAAEARSAVAHVGVLAGVTGNTAVVTRMAQTLQMSLGNNQAVAQAYIAEAGAATSAVGVMRGMTPEMVTAAIPPEYSIPAATLKSQAEALQRAGASVLSSGTTTLDIARFRTEHGATFDTLEEQALARLPPEARTQIESTQVYNGRRNVLEIAAGRLTGRVPSETASPRRR